METIYDHWWYKIHDLALEIKTEHPNFNSMKHIDKAVCHLIDAAIAISRHQDVLDVLAGVEE